MPDPVLITSAANPRLKAITALRRRRTREQQGRTVVEGFEELSLCLAAGVVPELVLLCPELMAPEALHRLAPAVADPGTQIVQTSRSAFAKVAYREGPDGVLAVVRASDRRCADLALRQDALVLVAQAIEKPGNLGAMLRTAEAAGVDAVVAADPVTDWGNPNTVRASKGTVFSVPTAQDPTAPMMDWLGRQGIPLVASTPDAHLEHTDIDYRGPIAIAVGAETSGLTDDVLQRAAYRVRIPMVGRVNSLNVAASAAILLYEAVRQRR